MTTIELLREAKKALERAEWGAIYEPEGGKNFCPECQSEKVSPHGKDCSLWKALSGIDDAIKQAEALN
jgi:hypothetical protein